MFCIQIARKLQMLTDIDTLTQRYYISQTIRTTDTRVQKNASPIKEII